MSIIPGLSFGLQSSKSTSQATSNSSANNGLALNFNPVIASIIGGGGVAPNYAGGGPTVAPVQTTTTSPAQSVPDTVSPPSISPNLSGLFTPAPPGPYNIGQLPTGLPLGSGQGVSAKLSSTTLILLGGVALLALMTINGGGGRRR